MKISNVWKRLLAILLCLVTISGNFLGVYAAENPETPSVVIDVTLEHVTAVFDKETYEAGDTVHVTLSPEDGYVLEPEFVNLTSEEKDAEFQQEKAGEDLKISFVMGQEPMQLFASAKKTYRISFSYEDMLGEDASDLFTTSVSPQILTAGTEVKISVNYSGSTGWTAGIKTGEESVDYVMSADSLTFEMPEGDVEVLLQEMESYDKGDLSEEDTVLGEDIGKQHDVTTKKEYEPDVQLGKSAKWDNIEEGLATLTLTEKDTSDWSDNPADYVIVLDRTRTMALNDLCFWSENDTDIGASHSVCLNENHFYMLSGLPVKLIDYSNGMMMSDKSYFTVNGSSRELWKRHYNSSGTRIEPNLSNGCTDRLTLAQKSIKDIMDVLDAQNKKELAGGLKNRVMYWSFSGPTYKDKNLHPDGLWNEVPQFTTDIANAKNSVKYESYAGTYYNNSFDKILKEIEKKQKDENYQHIPTKVIFISDGLQSDTDKNATAQMAAQIKAMPNTKIYTILIGNGANSDAGKLLKKYASNESCFATVNSNWSTFVDTITAIQSDQFEIKATEKVLVDVIETEYWEVIGEPKLEEGNGTASLAKNRTTLTWNIPEGAGKTYTCKLQLKLKDEYRYLLSDTNYPTNHDEAGATPEDILKDAKKAGAVLSYRILGGKYSGETRDVGIQTPKLKYGTVEFEGTKHWTVEGSSPERLKLILKRTMPGSTAASEINNTVTNVTKNWNYQFNVRQMPNGSTYPLIKYNNAGQKVDYTIEEELPAYYVQINKSEKESGKKVISDFYNEPYKMKIQLVKVDRETKNPLSGAEFSVYAWSKKGNRFVPYKGTKSSVTGAEEIMKMTEVVRGTYSTPAWVYYTPDNEGKFRIIETKAPEGYFGDWKDDEKNVYDFEISKDVSKNGITHVLGNQEDGTFGNERVKGEIHFAKLDVEAKEQIAQGEATLTGAVYKLYAAEDIVHQDGVTGVLHKKGEEIPVCRTGYHNGKNVYNYDPDGTDLIETGDLPEAGIRGLELGKYELKEVSASEGYLVDPKSYEFSVDYQDEKTKIVKVEKNVYERVKKQSLSFYKLTGADNSDKLDPLQGARFSVYLIHELENGKYEKLEDAEVVQAVIDDLRNPNTLLYDTYEKYKPATVYASAEDEDVTSKRLVKTVKYKNEKVYKAEGEQEYLVAELESDHNGVVKVPALPYGRYVVIETTTPKGKLATRPFIIHVTGDEQDAVTEGDGKGIPLQDQQLTVLIDRPIMSLVKILKRDVHSKEIVLKEGAAYVIHDVDGAWFDYITNEMTTAQKREYKKKYGDLVAQYSQGSYVGTKEHPFVTKNVEGDVFIETPMPLPNGMYELEEIKAPEGYILQGFEGVIKKSWRNSGNGTFYETEEDGSWKSTPQERTRFIISSSEAVYDENSMSFVTAVRQDNEPAIGKISIYAEGEKLITARKEKDSDDYKFIYGMKPLEGAEFEIRAAEDIYSQEGGDHRKKLYEKDELILTLTTDENGQTWTGQEDWEGTDIAKGLPLGKYHVIQKKAGEGLHLSEENKLPREIEITYAGQEVPVIYRDTVYTSPRQQVKIEVCKTDEKTGEKLSGAVFGLYAKEALKNHAGKTLVKAGTLVATAQTVKDGETVKNAVFAPDLPFGAYEVRELKAPDGYILSEEVMTVNAGYTGQDGDAVLNFTLNAKNCKTGVKFRKTDLLTGKDIAGAKLQVLEKETGKIVEEWTSDGSVKEIFGLHISGKAEQIYIFREAVPAPGYVTAKDIELKLVQDKNADGTAIKAWTVFVRSEKGWKPVENLTVEMKDDITRVRIDKVNGKTDKRISGARLELRDEKGAVVASWISSEKDGYYIEKLPVGVYTIAEPKKMEGYKKAEDLKIEVKDTQEVQKFVFENIPETPNVTQEPVGSSPKTGDAATIGAWSLLLGTAGAGWFAVLKNRRKKKK